MEGGASGFPFPRTVEEVFKDYKGRRAGLLIALTTDVENFYAQCDPEKENLCLFGYRNETWQVNIPVEEVPPEIPEPALGINFARDGMEMKDWLSLVAVHSDAWLMAVAFYFGARFGFENKDRRKLFNMINDLPTLFEIVSGKKQVSEKSTVTPNSSNRNKSNVKMQQRQPEPPIRGPRMPPQEQEEEDNESGEGEDDEQGATCGACGDSTSNDDFWICCDVCEVWFHGACVKITPAKAEHIKHYKCPACSNKRARV